MYRRVYRSVWGVAIAAMVMPTAQSAPLRDSLSHQALSDQPSVSASAISQLRSQGTAGLEAFLKTHAEPLKRSKTLQQLPPTPLRTALDALCKQRDCHASRLYWYTDLAQAKAQAQASRKPILSLRLLGNLDDELSCANSRFFRIALYPNAALSQYLRQNVVLHWQSVRSVPQVTIDFGDGRKLKRTLTGNSIHYLLDAEGRPVDALPGLYGPQAFLQRLQQAVEVWQRMTELETTAAEDVLRQYHRDRLEESRNNWLVDLNRANVANPPVPGPFSSLSLPALSREPTAVDAGRLAMSKAITETPLVSATVGSSSTVDRTRQQLEQVTDTATWLKIADLYADFSRLDRNSQALMRAKNTTYRSNSNPQAFSSTLNAFERAMALDTVRNQYMLHSQLHQWFVEGADTQDVDILNAKVYAQLFLTPNSDPWLGLVSEDIYSAIEEDGIQQ